MKDKLKTLLIGLLSIIVISGVVIAADITNTSQNEAENGDVITADWVNDVNNKLSGASVTTISISNCNNSVNELMSCISSCHSECINLGSVGGTLVGYAGGTASCLCTVGK